MRVVFMGTPDFAVPTLEALIKNHEVVGVVTQPDKRKGRGKAMAFPPVKEKALEHGIPVYQPVRVREEKFVNTLRKLAPEVIVVAAFGQILPESILNLPKYGCINVHASLLPKYRGAAPIQWAVIDGEKETGVTIMYMEKGLDTGDMIEHTVVPIAPKETGESLHDKLAAAGGPLLLDALARLEAGTAVRIPQKEEDSCYAKMLTKELGNIDWRKDALSIERLIRGLNSWPSAYTTFAGKTLKIWDADVETSNPGEKVPEKVPGTIVKVTGDAIYVQTGKGILKLNEVQMQGKKRMAVRAFLLGHKIEPGTIFGKDA
ncbi:MAG: methionyl-tRNA formyltransferase [Eubacterium sp.]|nr:methionyl-tRNA formyltransferase [Eubacterium sp.]MDD7209571.1 methionyl-tRNA formyltransferase [Lachnospiraceae bacterium]MDY5497171.1 methionyl-tRNA formyltransferase [Anaerobutyricum sp.]